MCLPNSAPNTSRRDVNEIVILLGAQIELQSCFAKQPTSRQANRFEAEVRAVSRQLERFPYSGRSYEGQFRRCLLRRFRYGLFYTLEGSRVMIHAVLDVRQSPAAIRRRLGLPPR